MPGWPLLNRVLLTRVLLPRGTHRWTYCVTLFSEVGDTLFIELHDLRGTDVVLINKHHTSTHQRASPMEALYDSGSTIWKLTL